MTNLTMMPMPSGMRVGPLQRSGPMTVAPLFGDVARTPARFLPPLSGLKLSRVAGYGNVEIECRRADVPDAVAIVPLHIGYVQDKAQNHALCRSALVGAGQKRMFDDACCVQQAQGGYLEERDQWFFVLPVALRDAALRMRGRKDFRKLWDAIAKLNTEHDLPARGHLEQIICRERYYLTQYASRFELAPEQTGALFFVHDELVGVEIAPCAEYFAETWMPLVCFSYGTLAKRLEDRATNPLSGKKAKREHALAKARRPPPLEGTSLPSLRASLDARRKARHAELASGIATMPSLAMRQTEEERYLDLRLSTIENDRFSGQMVEADGRLVYLSLALTSRAVVTIH